MFAQHIKSETDLRLLWYWIHKFQNRKRRRAKDLWGRGGWEEAVAMHLLIDFYVTETYYYVYIVNIVYRL